MKKFTLFTLIAGMLLISPFTGFTQRGPFHSKINRDLKVPARQIVPKTDETIGNKPGNYTVTSKSALDDPSTMVTRYDLQTNASCQNHLFLFPDGTMAGVANMSHTDAFADRGTGYNYFNGTSWGAQPSARIENEKCGWPSYAPLGPNGEIVVNHTELDGLKICKRPTRNSGPWTLSVLAGPAGAVDISWPRMVTNGPDHNYVHLIYTTYKPYQGLPHALLYARSMDGGQTWDIKNQILPGMTASEYLDFPADTYAWAEPHGDTIAFVCGDSWYDLFIMKSTDNGNTWLKTVIWPCPYNLWAGGDSVPEFYCPDGTNAIALDNNGMAHVAFGLQRGTGDAAGAKYWFPFTDGLIYWNESMPSLPAVINPDTLYAHGNYIGEVQDTAVFYAQSTELAYYYCSMSAMPQIVTDNSNNVYVIWSGVTNYRDGGNFMLRHIFQRMAYDNGQTWNDHTWDLTGAFIYNFEECVFPSAAPASTDKLFIQFQGDTQAGVFLKGSQGAQGQSGADNNDMFVMSPLKDKIGLGSGTPVRKNFDVSKNIPNPVKDLTNVNVNLSQPGTLNLDVYNTIGQKILGIDKGHVSSGAYQFTIDASRLPAGIYFYSVRFNSESITNKMVVE